MWILPDGNAVAQGGVPSASAEPSQGTPSVPAGPPRTEGGALAVTGERTGTLLLDRVDEESGYSLRGNDGRLILGGDPVEVVQVTFDGLDFYTDPDDCTIDVGEHNPNVGVAWADIECDEIRDIRDRATISVAGRVGVAAGVLRLTEDLPTTGGTLHFGDLAVEPTWATFDATVRPAVPGVLDNSAMTITSANPPRWTLQFSWNPEGDRLALFEVGFGAGTARAEPDACVIGRQLKGRHSPRASVIEVTLDCPAVDVPELGVVPIHGTVIVNQFTFER